ncbi:MFS transporter [Brachybacterium saurashtrense]|uniref:MFS transporter n=1 Tax=Brachybacterium saurashtrense TaxID=556288 RepID=A0A345YSK3_9MICO|nr:MFS transporter [Brachybacterium saurashtrense]AXK46905.1 MFS transporter [Brachybacterium saurashtrense]RRR22620.1 MFS transporter [Brachybacterium saurashtrense]
MTTSSAPRTRPLGLLLLIVAVLVLSLNLRPGATSVGPLMEQVVTSYGQGAIASGLLTALPPLAFGAMGLLAVPIARRFGLTGTIVAAFVLVALGLLLRPLAGSFTLFVALSGLALLGPALGNVVVPAWIKLHGGARTVGLMTLYSVVLALGGSAGSALAVPMAGGAAQGWRDSLQVWGLVVVVPVVVWAVVLTRTGHDFPPAPPRGELGGSLLRSPTAVALTLMFSLQSLNAYTQFGMLPQILTEAGISPARAGALVAVIAGWGLVGGLVMPTVIARMPGLRWLVAGFGVLTATGYLGLLLAPTVSPLLWACVLGVGGFAFPTAIALLPARTRSPLVTARLSGTVQPVGYLLAALGPVAAGALLGATGSSAAVLWFLAGTGALLAVAGYRASLPRLVDQEIAD